MYFQIMEYASLVDGFYKTMKKNAGIAKIKLTADKWSLAEMTGHLVDSASNNHQRFIRLQLEKKVFFPAYDAEDWKNVSHAASGDFAELALFWKQYNRFLLHIIGHIEEKSLQNVWQTGTEQKTLEFLVKDYFAHMQWHENLYLERIGEIKERA